MPSSSARSRRADNGEPAQPAIGPAAPDDVPALLALENAAFAGDRLTRRSLARLVRGATSPVLVARLEGALAGYAILLLHRRRRAARLYSIAVAQHFAGRGIGRALVEAACEAARRAGRSAVKLEVRTDNHRAAALYRRSGFADCATVEDYYEDGQAALRMVRTLDESDGARA